jgi:hypothetical protein
LWRWWPFAFSGFILGVYGGLITLMLVFAAGGKPADDKLLDTHSEVVVGLVTKVEGGADGRPIRPSYRFTTRSGRPLLNCRAFLDQKGIAENDPIEVEYVPGQPYINRPVGGKIALVPPLHLTFVWFFRAGVLCFAIWLTAVWRLRRLMIHGDITVGTVTATHPVPYVMPTTLRVDYSYRDHNAHEKTASHWVRARSALGIRIAENPKQIAVLLGRSGPGVSRLVMADDFVVELGARDDDSGIPDP